MADYGAHIREAEIAAMIREYGPKHLPALTEENLRYNIARARQAEAELAEIRGQLRRFKALLG